MNPGDIFNTSKYDGTLESERNLMYVTLTRAKDVLVVSAYTPSPGEDRPASVFFTEDTWAAEMRPLTPRDTLPLHTLSLVPTDSGELLTFSMKVMRSR